MWQTLICSFVSSCWSLNWTFQTRENSLINLLIDYYIWGLRRLSIIFQFHGFVIGATNFSFCFDCIVSIIYLFKLLLLLLIGIRHPEKLMLCFCFASLMILISRVHQFKIVLECSRGLMNGSLFHTVVEYFILLLGIRLRFWCISIEQVNWLHGYFAEINVGFHFWLMHNNI